MKFKEEYEVEIRNLYKSYGSHMVFNDLNINFKKNKINVILGPSGCGKTTLLNIISGIDKKYKGEVKVRESTISYIFQEDRLIPNLTVFENIAFVLKSTINKEEVEKITNKYLSLVKLTEYKDMLPKSLSGGMKRRVAIARAFAYKSRILLMDEPFKGLDEKLKNEIIEEFLRIHNKDKRTVILVTHDIKEAETLGDEIYNINSFTPTN
ncbi:MULTISPECIES: ABC transporter ATP-binding protein [Clostridium]|mgnify:CR=1 FL=1|uniref:Bicarbonate transport ATP-binding protein CmpD n=2 Tax=Clostridium TaxID=1485 RepID=A0A151AL28_9CLOT|nr:MULTISPECIES: ABC transporter ATP-binding protein [Clostridium]KYH28366.1 bicarbonate transport ATP-binding protein CmpD [Clostridium colicanis DSM 13634]MBE6043578.1 ABC transporter ATP-binding protein [Clostridium thermopalmarium]PRR68808.1 Bicarbonate transport ATP-binding protein CmpD [Clostridium thermopalmarium DSM 5974]PVZ22610.1 NitT/TauT family transport system ATP-binding protein [Clostridium thermopalmarium DSM 5974]